MRSIELGAVVRDAMQREGIVLSKEASPSRAWLDDQHNVDEIRALGPDVQWWGVMPFDGGYLLLPAPLLTYVRLASFEDFLRAVDHAGVEGRLSLAKVFPHYVDYILKLKTSEADN